MSLTVLECTAATCPSDKPRKRFSDANGLYLEVTPAGAKRWFWKYYIGSTEKRLALGSYPAVSLAAARLAMQQARQTKDAGTDPAAQRKQARLYKDLDSSNTFASVTREWYERQRPQWSNSHGERIIRRFERDLFPLLGERELSSITPPELLAVLRRIENRGAVETADRALMTCGQVWRYGVATGRVERNMCADLKGALTPYRGKHHAAIIQPEEFARLLLQIEAYKGTSIVKAALELAPLVFVRPNELRNAEWVEFDLTAALWTIPAQRMKQLKAGKENGVPHIVPLSKQAVTILQALYPFTGNNRYVFRGERDHERPMSDNTIRSALYSLGYSGKVMTGHGFRASSRTMLDEQLSVNPLVIEAQQAHAVKDANGRAYNRTQYLSQRAAMMQQWADYLDTLKTQARNSAGA